MKQVTVSTHLPGDAEQVLATITTTDYLRAKYEYMQAQHLSIEIEQDDAEHFRAQVRRHVQVREKVPAFARKLVKDVMVVYQRQHWQRSNRSGDVTIQVEGIRGGLTAQMTLVDHEAGQCQLTLRCEVKVGVPLIGAKLEQMIVDLLQGKFDEDMAASRYALAQIA